MGFFLAWGVLCRMFGVSDLVLPKPSEIVATLIKQFHGLLPHLIQTVYTTVAGFALGLVVGVLIGGPIGTSRLAYNSAPGR